MIQEEGKEARESMLGTALCSESMLGTGLWLLVADQEGEEQIEALVPRAESSPLTFCRCPFLINFTNC